MDDLVQANLVMVRRKSTMIEVEIRTDILFPSGSATLSPSAVDVIQRLANALQPFPNSIRVEGHTDNRPIKTLAFPSNWELSAATRSAASCRCSQLRGVDPTRLAVIGSASSAPAQSKRDRPWTQRQPTCGRDRDHVTPDGADLWKDIAAEDRHGHDSQPLPQTQRRAVTHSGRAGERRRPPLLHRSCDSLPRTHGGTVHGVHSTPDSPACRHPE